MSFICNICCCTFTQKKNLMNHLNEKRCKSEMLTDLNKLNQYIEDLKNQIIINGDHNLINSKNTNCNNNTIDMKVEINVNPITNLNLSYMGSDKLMQFIEMYDKKEKNPENLNLLLSDYISEIICNDDHPENHAIKYTKKKPPTFMTITEDLQGNPVCIIKGLKDTCELVSDPILDKLKSKMKHFIQKHKKDDNYNYDFFGESIDELRREFKKDNIKKALSSVLQNDIMNNIEMKITCESKPNTKLS